MNLSVVKQCLSDAYILHLRSILLTLFMVILSLCPQHNYANDIRVNASEVISGNLTNGTYDHLIINGIGPIDDILLEDVVVQQGKIHTVGNSGRTRLLGLDSDVAGADIEIANGRLNITLTVSLPPIFMKFDDDENSAGMDQTLVPMKERITIYLSGDSWGISDLSIQIPTIDIKGLFQIKQVIFEFREDPFFLHLGGGIFLLKKQKGAGIGGELAIGFIQPEYPGLIKLSGSAAGMNVDLFETGAFLQGVKFDIENVSFRNLPAMVLGAGVSITAGPEFGGISAFLVNAEGKIRPWPFYIDIKADMSMFGFIPLGGAELSYSAPYDFYVSYNTTYLAGVVKWDGSIRIGSYRNQFIEQVCPISVKPDAGWDASTDECIVNTIDIWGSVDYGFQLVDSNNEPTHDYYEATIESQNKAKAWDTVINGEANASIGIPDYIPIIGGMSFASATARVTDKFIYLYGKITAAFVDVCHASVLIYPNEKVIWEGGGGAKIVAPVNAWETPYNQQYIFDEVSQQLIPVSEWRQSNAALAMESEENKPIPVVSFMSNWDRVDAITTGRVGKKVQFTPQGEPITNLQIPYDAQAVIFRLNYENENVTELIMSITLPDGTVLDMSNGALPDGYASVSGFSLFRPNQREASIALSEPEGGDYVVTIENSESLGNFTVEALIQNHVPEVEIISIEPTGEANQYRVTWYDEDPDSSAIASVYLDRDRQGGDGFLIGVYQEDNIENSHIINTDQLTLPAGDYYIAISVHDNKNNIVWAYSDQTIRIAHHELPDAVQDIAVGAYDGQFAVRWTPSIDENVEGYVVMYTAQGDLGYFECEKAIYGRTTNQTVVDGVENGAPLLVTVVAVDMEQRRSHPETILRVIPHKPDGSTPQMSTSEPGEHAQVGVLYVHKPKFTDSERHFYLGHTMTWELLENVGGMTLNPENGLILWTPTAEQTGENLIRIERKIFLNGELLDKIDESFIVTVGHRHEMFIDGNTANHILNAPKLSARAGAAYTHRIETHDLNGDPTFTLIEGPEGMTCDQTGMINWQVPENAKSTAVRIIVTFKDGNIEEVDYFLDIITKQNTLAGSSSWYNETLK